MFIERTLTSTIKRASNSFPALLVTGPRQVGKTSLLEHCAPPDMKYVTLDDLLARELALTDPELFLQRYEPPVIIDEIQYAPSLFPVLKILIDKAKQPGMIWLTGSQQFHLMQNVSESLAGRIGILQLSGLSQAERQGRADTLPFLPLPTHIAALAKQAKATSLNDIYQRIWRGSYPACALHPEMDRDLFYSAYLQTYVQRDVKALTQIGDEITFVKFIRCCAARTGQLLNIAELGRDAEVDAKTAKAWLSILEASGLITLLQPYHNNLTKRITKTPKLYFLDTGLAAYLTNWESAETLEAGALSGAIFETYVVGEILKSYWHNGKQPRLYFYRDKDLREIDLLIESDGKLHPIEIKKTAKPTLKAIQHFATLAQLGVPVGHGAVICLRQEHLPLTDEVDIVPVDYL